MTHFKFFYYFLLIWCEKRVAVCCFAYDYTICWKDYLFPLKWLLTLMKSNWPVYTLSLFPGLVFYPSQLCVFIPELYYLDYCSSIPILEVGESKYSDCVLCQNCFSHMCSSAVPYNFRTSSSNSTNKHAQIRSWLLWVCKPFCEKLPP